MLDVVFVILDILADNAGIFSVIIKIASVGNICSALYQLFAHPCDKNISVYLLPE